MYAEYILETRDNSEVVVSRCSVKKVFLKISQNSQKNTFARVSFLIKLQVSGLQPFYEKTLVQMFSSEFCEIFFKNTYFYRASLVVASNKYLMP